MALTRDQKSEIIGNVAEKFGRSNAAFLVDFKGMDVEQVTRLRKGLFEIDAELKVVRNTLAKLALNDFPSEQEVLEKEFTGTNAFVFAYDDASASAKLLKNYAEEIEHLEVKAGVMNGKGLSQDQIEALADLPSIEVLRATFLGVLQAPAQKFVGTLAAVPGGFARLLNAYKETKGDS